VNPWAKARQICDVHFIHDLKVVAMKRARKNQPVRMIFWRGTRPSGSTCELLELFHWRGGRNEWFLSRKEILFVKLPENKSTKIPVEPQISVGKMRVLHFSSVFAPAPNKTPFAIWYLGSS